jgi:A/G-specific adenine glycosylase
MSSFAARVIAWQQSCGRHDLPWQNTRDPYAVWVSEIMLQQTQVAAVIPYYRRFLARFPDISSLARAEEDEVLQQWSGLGYYSRARNLHAAARGVMAQHNGVFPRQAEIIATLPGIGRSTAAAIAAFCFGQRHAILDGNVKRVFARCFGVEGWPGLSSVENRLWAQAEALLPYDSIEAYTQGLMDLGATVCTRSKPACSNCPLAAQCIAYRDKRVTELPFPKPRKALPQKQTVMLLLCKGREILLEKRPPKGIWGGLWSLPEVDAAVDPGEAARLRFGVETERQSPWPVHTHAFSHFCLQITLQPLIVVSAHAMHEPHALWLNRQEALGAAVPAPVRKILQKLD